MAAHLSRLTLKADTAGELMTVNPISVRMDADIGDALTLMTDRGFMAAPVIDDGGRPVGVVSVSDILIHNRESMNSLNPSTRAVDAEREIATGATCVSADYTTVGEIMTPTVFSVQRQESAAHVVKMMLSYQVHHLFVADDDGILIGVISSGDIIRKLA